MFEFGFALNLIVTITKIIKIILKSAVLSWLQFLKIYFFKYPIITVIFYFDTLMQHTVTIEVEIWPQEN